MYVLMYMYVIILFDVVFFENSSKVVLVAHFKIVPNLQFRILLFYKENLELKVLIKKNPPPQWKI